MLQDTATVALPTIYGTRRRPTPILFKVCPLATIASLSCFTACGFPWCAWFWAHQVISAQAARWSPGAMQLLLHSSEVKAAVLLLAAVWLLVPFALKLFRSVVAGRKLRHVPGPRMGLRGVTPVLRVRTGFHTVDASLSGTYALGSAESQLHGLVVSAICLCTLASALLFREEH